MEESAEITVQPFLDLLKIKPSTNRKLWGRQLLALQVGQRLDEKALEPFLDQLRDHPYDAIRQWIQERFKQAQQDVIWPAPSGYELVWIKGGTFMMDSNEYDSEKPVHKVTIPDFYMGRYPVTNEEYGRFIQATGYKEPEYWGDRKYNQSQQPVVGVSWYDAKAFAEWSGLQLPSESQWEYACRAETTTLYYTGDSEADLDRAGWYRENSDQKLHPVGEKEPNVFGLYDMHGNVYEWCEDHWHDNYKEAPVDGSAWVDQKDGAFRVIRGGTWEDSAWDCRTAYRNAYDPGSCYSHYDYCFGFRLVRLPGQNGEPGKSSGDA